MLPKCGVFKRYVIDNTVDLVGVSKTWHTDVIMDEMIQIGILLYIKNYILYIEIKNVNNNTAEQVWVTFNFNKVELSWVCYTGHPLFQGYYIFFGKFEENFNRM